MDKIILPYRGKTPTIHPTAFIAPTAAVIGDVESRIECVVQRSGARRFSADYDRAEYEHPRKRDDSRHA